MTVVKVALANIRYPKSPEESVALAVRSIADGLGWSAVAAQLASSLKAS